MQTRLTATTPFAHRELLAFLAARAVPGVEEVVDGTYRRTLPGPGIVAVRPDDEGVDVTVSGGDPQPALAAVARIFDLDAPAPAIDAVLARDPVLRPLVRARPGLRVPGAADAAEMLVRAIAGQQVSVAGARTTLGRIAAAHGEPLPAPDGALTHLFPSPARLAAADPAGLGMPRARGAAIVGGARACAGGLVDGVDRGRLLELRGVGAWTADYVAMRALGDRDAYLPGDLGVRHALTALGGADPDRWRPYRAHAVQHLWAVLGVTRQNLS